MGNDTPLKLHPAVFYRSSDDETTLYQTAAGKAFGLAGIAADVLDEFKEPSLVSQAISDLEVVYGMQGDKGFRDEVSDFICQMRDEGVLLEEFTFDAEPSKLRKGLPPDGTAPDAPETVTIETTYRCNEKCRHCYIPGGDGSELSTSELKDVIDQLAEMGTLNVVFTGGEFFVREDALELLEHAYGKNMLVDVFTNGTRLDAEAILRLKATWPRCVHFSLYSHTPERHDAVTQAAGSFARTTEAAKRCSLVGIPVNIKAPIFKETLGDVEGLVELARGLRATIEIGGHVTPKKGGDLSPTSMGIQTEGEHLRLKEAMACAFGEINREPVAQADASETAYRTALCGAGVRSLCVSPSGEVYPCAVLQLPLGNVRERPIKEIWTSSPSLAWWRGHNKKECRKGCDGCELSAQCAFCPGEALMRTGDPLARYQAACSETAFNRKWDQGGR